MLTTVNETASKVANLCHGLKLLTRPSSVKMENTLISKTQKSRKFLVSAMNRYVIASFGAKRRVHIVTGKSKFYRL